MCSVTDAIEAAKAALVCPPLRLDVNDCYIIQIEREAHGRLLAQLERALMNMAVLERGLQSLLTSPAHDGAATLDSAQGERNDQ